MFLAALIIFLFAAPIIGIGGIFIHVRMARFRWALNLVVLPAMVLTGPFFAWLMVLLSQGGDAVGFALGIVSVPYLVMLTGSLLLYVGIVVSQLRSERRLSNAMPPSR